jgi:hypothetical protein
MFLQLEWVAAAVVFLVVVIVVVAVLASSIRVVPEFMRLVVFRLGRLIGVKGPGLVFLIPVIDQRFLWILGSRLLMLLSRPALRRITRLWILTSLSI